MEKDNVIPMLSPEDALRFEQLQRAIKILHPEGASETEQEEYKHCCHCRCSEEQKESRDND